MRAGCGFAFLPLGQREAGAKNVNMIIAAVDQHATIAQAYEQGVAILTRARLPMAEVERPEPTGGSN